MTKSIAFNAIFKRVTTTVDGGWSLTFSLDASEASQVMQLSQFRDCLLSVGVVPVVRGQALDDCSEDVQES
jgi:hypothetical protein